MLTRVQDIFPIAGFVVAGLLGRCCLEPRSVEVDDSLRESYFSATDALIVADIIKIGDFAAEGISRADAFAAWLGYCAASDELERI